MSTPTRAPQRARGQVGGGQVGVGQVGPAARRAPRPMRGSRPPAARTAAGRPATRAAAASRPGDRHRGLLPTGRAATVLMCGAVLLAALLLALWTNIALSRGSYAERDLVAQRTVLAEQEQALSEHLQDVSSAGALDARAQALGMVRAPDSAWLVLEAPQEQAVVGDPEVATTATPTPAPGASADPSAGGPVDGEAGEVAGADGGADEDAGPGADEGAGAVAPGAVEVVPDDSAPTAPDDSAPAAPDGTAPAPGGSATSTSPSPSTSTDAGGAR